MDKKTDIGRLERLAKLRLTEGERAQVSEDVDAFVGFCAVLDGYDSAPLTVDDTRGELRRDEARPVDESATSARFSVPLTVEEVANES